jgi:hypothetical protein
LFQGSINPGKGITDLEKYRLKGNVKTIMETMYTVGKGADSLTRGGILYQKYTEFNYDGYETSFILYKNEQPNLYGNYIFGPEGWQIGLKENRSDGRLNSQVTFFYDPKGFKVKAKYRWGEDREIVDFEENTDYYFEILNNDIFTIVVFKNEYRGYSVQEDYLRSDSTLSFRFKYRYDFRGNKLECAYFHGDEHLSWMTKYEYDRYDNMIGSRVFKSNHIAVNSTYNYQFDALGNWTYRKEYREVFENILTSGLEKSDIVTEREIKYF